MRKKELIKSFKLIAHRLGYLMTDYPENSLDAIKTIFNTKELLNSCDGFEFDICFTKDNIPIVIHDKYIDDISNNTGYVKKYNLKELKQFKYSFRKSLKETNDYYFNILTLEEILEYFKNNQKLLGNKIIKIETKEANKFNKKNLINLSKILNKYSSLKNNIVHLSYWPQNLIRLKKIQKKYNYIETKNDLLCDYKFVLLYSLSNKIDNISLRLKTLDFPKKDKNNTKRVNRKIFIDKFLMRFSNIINEKTIKKIINKYSSIGIFVLNTKNDFDNLFSKVNIDFLEKIKDKVYITTDNPIYLKKIK